MKLRLILATIYSSAIAVLCASAVLSTAAVTSRSKSKSELPTCERDSLPAELQHELDTSYSSWKIQDVPNLSARAKERWQGEKPLACPGIAVGQFEIPGQSSYAFLLVPRQKPDFAYKILVFSPNPDHSAFSLKLIHQWDKGGAANNFIHTVAITKVFSAEWVRKLKVGTRDGILAVESAEDEYGVEVFFWSNGTFRHEPIDD
jgi:hypothetical protein